MTTHSKPPEFNPARLKKTGDGFYLAYGSDCYLVDLLKGTCTCPSFRYRRRCKHLESVEKTEGWRRVSRNEPNRPPGE
ncbi:MAG: SWIM zinc finger family protein [Desulfotomaculales bacterium]